MTKFDQAGHHTKWIAVKDLSVLWAQAQRELKQDRVDKIAAEFDPDLFDDLVVTLPNGHGVYHVVDGQHRRAAMQQLYGEEEMVPCRIINAQTPDRAAAVFIKINTGRKAPSVVEQYNVRVTAGCDTETHINRILDALGYRVARHQGAGIIQSVNALISVYKNYGSEVLKEALQTIKATWGDDSSAASAYVIRGYGALIAEHRTHIDFKRLREVVPKEMSPGQLIGRAKYHREMTKASLDDAVKHELVKAYNAGLRTGKLGG